jgi:hypothetical protein
MPTLSAGLKPLMAYIDKCKASILVFAQGREIYQKCRRSTPIASNANQLIWWELAENL